MPPPKKAAKKSAQAHRGKHRDLKGRESKDLRRAYEHLGRVEALQQGLAKAAQDDVHTLVALAQEELRGSHTKDAADLLRASEHLSFAALAQGSGRAFQVSGELAGAILKEFEHLAEKAEDHWKHENKRHAEVATLYKSSLENAQAALERGSYREALELARAAEALAHVKKHRADKVSAGRKNLELASS